MLLGPAVANTNNSGPHGLSEILYAYSSGAGNNGSAFAGINANTPWYNLTLGLDMLVGKFLLHHPGVWPLPEPGRKEADSRDQWHAADQRHPLCGPADRDRDHCRRTDVFPGALTRSDCRTLSNVERKTVLNSRRNKELEDVYCYHPAAGAQSRASREHRTRRRLSHRGVRARPLFDPEILKRAIKESFVKLNPRLVAKNPVMFVVEVGAALTTVFVIKDAFTQQLVCFFGIQIALWLWFTVLFANFAEAMAEARGKAQADALRKTKTDAIAHKILPNDKFEMVPASALRAGDVVYL